MKDGLVGPAHVVLMASLARGHFILGKSKIELAEEFVRRRFKVARLIDEARDSGLVRIEIRHHGEIDVDLSARLGERFELTHSVVGDTPGGDWPSRGEHPGRAAAELLTEIITSEDVLGLAWARAVSAMVRSLRPLPGTAAVQLTGAPSLPERGDTCVGV